MTEVPTTEGSPRGSDLRAALASNLDFTFAGVAAIAFVAAQIAHPTAKCGPGVHPSTLFFIFAWTSGLGFVLASFLAFVSRKHIVAKIALFVVGLVVTLFATIALVLASSPFGMGLVDSDSERPTMQSQLRLVASPRAAGKHAYWLGPSFRDATVNGTQGYWSPDVQLWYSHIDESGRQDVYILVRNYRGRATQKAGEELYNPSEVVHTRSGQDVRITFQQPRQPDAAIMAEARAAVQAIPRDVEYSGCD
jgi:hypothetical protein